MLIVVAGLGGGTGGGAAKVMARLAREENVPTFFMLAFPFAFEGRWLHKQAQDTLNSLRDVCNVAMVVQNDLLFTSLPADTPANRAFEILDATLGRVLLGVASIAWAKWMLKTDFTTIRKILRKHNGTCAVGSSAGHGENRWQQAIDEFVKCPLLGGKEVLKKADAAVVTVAVSKDLSAAELSECLTQVQDCFPEQTKVVVGAWEGENIDEVRITGIICLNSTQIVSETDNNAAINARSVSGSSEKKNTNSAKSEKNLRNQSTTKDKNTIVQGELPFQEQMLGFFSGVSPTRYRGENLDVPTFQRRSINIDAG